MKKHPIVTFVATAILATGSAYATTEGTPPAETEETPPAEPEHGKDDDGMAVVCVVSCPHVDSMIEGGTGNVWRDGRLIHGSLSAWIEYGLLYGGRGLYASFGLAETQFNLAIPCPTPAACNVASYLHVSRHTPSYEVEAGFRFNRFLSVQVGGSLWTNGNNADIREVLPSSVPGFSDQYQAKAGINPVTLIRPALRADWPLVPTRLSVFATYGMLLEDLHVHTEMLTGRVVIQQTGGCHTDPLTDMQVCTPVVTAPAPEVGFTDYHHRHWRSSPSIGFEAFKFLRVEYMPRLNGRVGSYILGLSVHWQK